MNKESNVGQVAKLPPATAASAAGFHFYQLFQCCPRKFYLRYVVGLDTMHVAPALIYGAAFHEAKAQFYRSESIQEGLDAGMAFIEANRKNYSAEDLYEKDAFRLPILYRAWVVKWGLSDLVKYDVVQVEREMQVTLPNGYVYTGRPDTVLRDKQTGKLYIMETKTSGFSKTLTMDNVFYGDQVTSYLALLQMGKCSDGGTNGVTQQEALEASVLCDVAYWNKNAKYEDNIDCVRSEPIARSSEEIADFINGVAQLFSEISQKVEAIKQGVAPEVCFQRNTYYCLSYSKPCEFVDVCRMRVRPGDTPFGYVVKGPGSGLSAPVADGLAES